MTEPETGRIGSSFDDFLREQGVYDETSGQAVKRVIAYQLAHDMKQQGISKVAMAKKLATSRTQLDRLLDPDNDGVTVSALAKAARAVGRSLSLELR